MLHAVERDQMFPPSNITAQPSIGRTSLIALLPDPVDGSITFRLVAVVLT